MGFKALIQKHIDSGEVLEDPSQQQLVGELSRLYNEMLTQVDKPPGARANGLTKWFTSSQTDQVPKGVYIWGGVGRGKTYLMNLFFENAPTEYKWRIHFHRFMLWVHEQKGQLEDKQDPLQLVAQQVSVKYRLLCLDEFMVTDIADAMILHRLLKHLSDQELIIVTTSNIHPDDLYHNGIQRDSFLPAIELIKQHCALVHVDGQRDFRRHAWICGEIYFSPLGQSADAGIALCHTQLTGLAEPQSRQISIAGRTMQAISIAEDVAWFDFENLCQTYRSQKDYVQLSNQFSTIIVSDVPELGPDDDSATRRFINLIDTAYDHDVNLVVSAAQAPDQLYTGTELAEPFKRTASRLWEMATPSYLTRQKKI